jgi:hypothetical protein
MPDLPRKDVFKKTVSSAPKIMATYALRITRSALRPVAASALPIGMRAGADASGATVGAEIELS